MTSKCVSDMTDIHGKCIGKLFVEFKNCKSIIHNLSETEQGYNYFWITILSS